MNSVKSLLAIAVFIAIWSPFYSTAQTSAPGASTNAAAVERFLVVVETSTAMQKRADNAQKILGSVISSGLSGHIGSGSTVGFWTFNESLSTGQLPLQLWTQPNRQRVALTMVQFLQQQKYEKLPRFASAWVAVSNIVANSERITILLITSGTEPMVGTPFAAAISESFSKNLDQQRKNNMPFLTILRAVKGEFVAFAVNIPPWPLEVPEYPDGFKPAPPPPLPKVEPKSVPPVVKRPDPAILSPTNTIYLAETSPPVEVPIVATVLPKEPTNQSVAVEPPPVLEAKPETKPQPKVAPPQEQASPLVDSTAGNGKKFPIVTILIAGIALLLGVLVVFIALLRWSRRSVGASLITHSMNKHDP